MQIESASEHLQKRGSQPSPAQGCRSVKIPPSLISSLCLSIRLSVGLSTHPFAWRFVKRSVCPCVRGPVNTWPSIPGRPQGWDGIYVTYKIECAQSPSNPRRLPPNCRRLPPTAICYPAIPVPQPPSVTRHTRPGRELDGPLPLCTQTGHACYAYHALTATGDRGLDVL